MGLRSRQEPPYRRSVRGKALLAAGHILESRGPDALNLRAIAEEAGVGIASIYHYFRSKEEILLSLATAGFEQLRADIVRLRTDPVYQSQMRGGARAFFHFAETQPQLFALMFNVHLLSRHESLRDAEHGTFLAYEDAVRADNRIAPEHQSDAAFALWALGRGMAAIISSHPDGRLPADLAGRLSRGAAYLVSR